MARRMNMARWRWLGVLGALLFMLATFACKAERTQEDNLVWAIWEHDHAQVQALLDAGADINKHTGKGLGGDGRPRLALIEAARHGDVRMVELLLDVGADVNGIGSTHFPTAREDSDYRDHFTALGAATYMGEFGVMELLIERGADVNPAPAGVMRSTPISLAARGDKGMVKLLLDHGADPNTRGWKQQTPLHIAASQEEVDVEMIERLIAAGANINVQDEHGDTPFDRARSEDVRVVLEKAGGKRGREL